MRKSIKYAAIGLGMAAFVAFGISGRPEFVIPQLTQNLQNCGYSVTTENTSYRGYDALSSGGDYLLVNDGETLAAIPKNIPGMVILFYEQRIEKPGIGIKDTIKTNIDFSNPDLEELVAKMNDMEQDANGNPILVLGKTYQLPMLVAQTRYLFEECNQN